MKKLLSIEKRFITIFLKKITVNTKTYTSCFLFKLIYNTITKKISEINNRYCLLLKELLLNFKMRGMCLIIINFNNPLSNLNSGIVVKKNR